MGHPTPQRCTTGTVPSNAGKVHSSHSSCQGKTLRVTPSNSIVEVVCNVVRQIDEARDAAAASHKLSTTAFSTKEAQKTDFLLLRLLTTGGTGKVPDRTYFSKFSLMSPE